MPARPRAAQPARPRRPAVAFARPVSYEIPMLRAWDDAPAIILSCPTPPRRHAAALLPIAATALPQCLLGGEAQLHAFVAAMPDLRARLFFAPAPELFSDPPRTDALLEQAGARLAGAARPVHLRFGGTRAARVLKEMRNGLVLAENHAAPPIIPGRHPFADGLTLPASMRRLFTYSARIARPATIAGAAIPITRLPPDMLTADIPAGRARTGEGLEIVSLAEFRSGPWAAGPVRARSAHLRAAQAAPGHPPFILLPWNLDDPGSAVPALVERTQRAMEPGAPALRLILLPYNYPGQTGLIRRLVRGLREAEGLPPDVTEQIFIARISDLAALPALRALARTAWVDGNDPEYEWTARRLQACGIEPIVLSAHDLRLAGLRHVKLDDTLPLAAESRFGLLHYRVRLPSLRTLRALVPLTGELAARGARRA